MKSQEVGWGWVNQRPLLADEGTQAVCWSQWLKAAQIFSPLTPRILITHIPMSSGEATPWHPTETQKGKNICSISNPPIPYSSWILGLAFYTSKATNWSCFLIPSSSQTRCPSPLWSLSTPNYTYGNSLPSVACLHPSFPNTPNLGPPFPIPQFFILLSPKAAAVRTFIPSVLLTHWVAQNIRTYFVKSWSDIVTRLHWCLRSHHTSYTQWFVSSLESVSYYSLLGVG